MRCVQGFWKYLYIRIRNLCFPSINVPIPILKPILPSIHPYSSSFSISPSLSVSISVHVYLSVALNYIHTSKGLTNIPQASGHQREG